MLPPNLSDDTAQPSIIVGGESAEPEQVNNKSNKIEIWNYSIELNFQTWMESEGYAPTTAKIYCSAVNRTVQNFKPLVDAAGSESFTALEAVRKFVSLLHQDSEFIAANSTARNQLSSALTALTRFVDSGGSNDTAVEVASAKTANNATYTTMAVKVLSVHFPNGFRIDSPIELLRFRRFADEDFGDEISIADEELIKSIASCGTFFDGKVYVIESEIERRIQSKVDLSISGGAEIIFYNAFYSRYEEWLFAGSVISEKMLKDILVKLYPKYTHKANYFSSKDRNVTELAKIRSEIMRVWGSDVVLKYEQLSERLPYIPLDKIKYVLAQNGDFIWNATEVYTHVGRVDVSDEECAAIADYVAVACRTDGYASLSDVPLGEIVERNYKLTLTSIHNAVFGIVLADKYCRRGKIITRRGDTLDAITIMKEHCRTLDKCSLQDLLDFERELTGESHRWIPMKAGYSVMVRADENSYIAEKYVHFDAAKIDRALDLFVTGEYLPLKSVTTFAAFPHCGQAWNLFLLESYCRRFSDKYRFEVLTVNSKNAGVIVRKRCRLSYLQIMADAVAKSVIPLEKAAIEEFLCYNGYIGRRSYAKTDELIEQAKAIRERRD